MKRLLTVTIFLFASLLYSQTKYDINNLIDKDGLKYAPNDDKPYTGRVFDSYDNGQKMLNGRYRKGLMNGHWMYYYENGQIRFQGRFINGDGSYPDDYPDSLKYLPFGGRNGKWTTWYENRQKLYKGTYKDGERNGLQTWWYENGQKGYEGTFKDAKSNGQYTRWYKSGVKMFEGEYRNDLLITDKGWKPNGQLNETNVVNGTGKVVDYYETGQKKYEGTFKDGEEISNECWDKDGNEMDCSELY